MFFELEKAIKRHCCGQRNTCNRRLRQKIANMMIKIIYFANPPELSLFVEFYVGEFA